MTIDVTTFDTFVYNCPVCKEDTTSKIITIFGENRLLTIGDEFYYGETILNHSPCKLCKAINIVVAENGKITEFKALNPEKDITLKDSLKTDKLNTEENENAKSKKAPNTETKRPTG